MAVSVRLFKRTPIPWRHLRLTAPHSRSFGRRPIVADGRQRVFLLEEFILFELHQDLRGCLKTCQTSQATDHEMDHRHTDHGFTGLG